jgi:hypothetical protein
MHIYVHMQAFLRKRIFHAEHFQKSHTYIHTYIHAHVQVNEAFLDSISELVMVLQRSSDTYVDTPCAELVRGPIKKPDRAIQKIARTYDRDPASLTDLVRCTVVVAGLREAAAFLALIEQRSVVGLANVVVEGFDRCRFVHEYEGDTQKTMRITKLENRSGPCVYPLFSEKHACCWASFNAGVLYAKN